ncbi:MAG: PilZ domain-containing protein [Candidatus Omnitrophica bacterium]|nr:PilZ domain-containing protein [Candidatus Omnitrophota bacterium]
MADSTDKRKHERVKAHIPIRYRKLRDGAGIEGVSSITKNLSQGGIRFRTAGFVSMACRLILEMDIPMFTKSVKAISKVAWIRKNDSGDGYEIGNQFLEMSKQDKELVSEYVDSLGKGKSSEKPITAADIASKTESSSGEEQ